MAEILKHQLLSERRFFGEFVGTPEPPPAEVLPASLELDACIARMAELARPRLTFLRRTNRQVVDGGGPVLRLARQRIWVFWRRVLHTCHHRTQLTMYLRMLNKPVPSVYGPTADETWDGADPTSVGRRCGKEVIPAGAPFYP